MIPLNKNLRSQKYKSYKKLKTKIKKLEKRINEKENRKFMKKIKNDIIKKIDSYNNKKINFPFKENFFNFFLNNDSNETFQTDEEKKINYSNKKLKKKIIKKKIIL